MAQQTSKPLGDSYSQPYRVLVTARPDSRPRVFIWQIVRDTVEGLSIRATSTVSFKTMSEAYIDGTAALSRLARS
jgi:hypothetical protein